MDEEPASFGQNVQVIDPDVRAYVYSLVTAVSALWWSIGQADISSLEASMARMQISMS